MLKSFLLRFLCTIININKYHEFIPWNNKPAPFGNPSKILERKKNEKKNFGDKKNFFGGEKLVFLKKNSKNFLEKIWKKFFFDFFCRFFQYYGHIF